MYIDQSISSDPDVIAFRSLLEKILNRYCPGWSQRRNNATSFPYNVAPITLQRWVSGSIEIPRRNSFEEFLNAARNIPPETINELRLAYEKISRFNKNEQSLIDTASHNNAQLVLAYTRTYKDFIGRESILDTLFEEMCDPKGKRIIGVFGLGGTGKTALAVELASLSKKEGVFDFVVWISGKEEILTENQIHLIGKTNISFETILQEIAKETGQEDLLTLTHEDRKVAIKDFLLTYPVLLILDNLDTVSNVEQMISKLYDIMGISRLLLTSRHQIDHFEMYSTVIKEMDEGDGLKFLRSEVLYAGLGDLLDDLSDGELRNLWQQTGGMPLMMRLVVGQLHSATLKQTSEYLTYANEFIKDTNTPHPHRDLYRFIYKYSWLQLSRMAQTLLLRIGPIGTEPCLIEDVKGMCKMGETEFTESGIELVRCSLLYKVGYLGREKYAMHTNTVRFVRGDLTIKWTS